MRRSQAEASQLLALACATGFGPFVVRADRDDAAALAALTGAGPPGEMKGMGKSSKRSREASPRYEVTRTGNTRLKRRKRRGR